MTTYLDTNDKYIKGKQVMINGTETLDAFVTNESWASTKGTYTDDIDTLYGTGVYQVLKATNGTMPTINGTSITSLSNYCVLVVKNPWKTTITNSKFVVQKMYCCDGTYNDVVFTRTYNISDGGFNPWKKNNSILYGSSSTGYSNTLWTDGDIYVQYE